MPRILQLPTSVITKIAAGEVIERPSSVVKELLENSVDAGSTCIDVEVEQGGTEVIRVVDNGCGIHADDLLLAFASHATSKLSSADDLFRIGTMGFRGEALASIGGVAQVTLQSRPADRTCGAEIGSNGGELSAIRPWNGAPGTRIEVRHLFFNTPVRRKFLKTMPTEMGHVSEAVTRLALSHPQLQLNLRHNGKRVYEVPASAPLVDRIGLFFGADLKKQLYELDVQAGPLRLHGWIADPAAERGSAKMQYLFVNGRWVRDRSLGHALQEAYRGLLMTGRYAVAFLFLDLPPDQVDVNIHPTKSEVRFRDSHAAYHLVLTAVRERLRKENLTAQLRVSTLGIPQMPNGTAPWSLSPSPAPAPLLPLSAPAAAAIPGPVRNAESAVLPAWEQPASEQASTDSSDRLEMEPRSLTEESAPAPWISDPKVLQLYDSYLVVETPEGMLVIDQHALHERILFEHLKQRIGTGDLEIQRLLIPEPVDLSAEQAARTLEHRGALAELGLEVDDFGGGTLLLTSYPAILGHRSPQGILKAVVDHLVTQERPPTREVLLNDLLSLMACHAAVRAGDRLTADQISALVAQRSLANDTHHCPHGRPTTLLFSKHDLDRQFRRV
ncbi:MAG: DNA mismatch repair endonuclease MutL [Gemmataceae bacterium]|nr:DNA mismatch repair endonuclease MutL [Gemmataceae bacterium]